MADKGLKSLSRSELLELLLAQTRENEQLRRDLLETRQQLRDRMIRMESVGDLASAVLEVNGVMNAAQAAAKQYLDNIIEMERETRLTCQKLLAEAKEDAARIRHQAKVGEESEEDLLAQLHTILQEDADTCPI